MTNASTLGRLGAQWQEQPDDRKDRTAKRALLLCPRLEGSNQARYESVSLSQCTRGSLRPKDVKSVPKWESKCRLMRRRFIEIG